MTDESQSAEAAAWLKNAEGYVGTVQAVMRGLWVFVGAMLVTLVIQHRQLIGYQQELKATLIADLPEWVTLRAAYEEFPPNYLGDKLGTWYRFLVQSTILATFMNGDKNALAKDTSPGASKIVALIEQAGTDIPSEATVQEMSKALLSLRDYNSDIRAVVWPINAKIDFEDLNRDELGALVRVYSYSLDPNLAPGEQAAKALATVFINRHLETVKNSAGEVLFNPPFPEIMKSGATLHNLTTVFGDLAVQDLETFGNHPLQADRAKGMLSELKATTFTSIKEAKRKNAELQRKIDDIQSGDASSPVKVPLIDLELSLADFGYMSSALNAALLGWILWSLRGLRVSLLEVRRARPIADHDVVVATIFSLPGTRTWRHLFIGLLAFFLSLPSILGTVVLQSQLHKSSGATLAFIVPAIGVFALALCAAAYCSNVKLETLKAPKSG
jgi:hypothetical protein